MKKLKPFCSFIIAGSWPTILIVIYTLMYIHPKVFGHSVALPKSEYEGLLSLLVLGFSNLIAGYIWQYLKRDLLEYARFFVAGIVSTILGVITFHQYHRISWTDPVEILKYVGSVFVASEIAFVAVYLLEQSICGTRLVHLAV